MTVGELFEWIANTLGEDPGRLVTRADIEALQAVVRQALYQTPAH